MADKTGPTEFSGKITVASRIIDLLSSGLYPSPAACLKELVNNSYDADAINVNIYVKPDADRIIIEDDGIGMNRKEFETHFKRISESHKRDKSDVTAKKRPKIGKIGIGFIAANEICEVMEIFSTKAGSKELLHVYINFAEMRKPLEERRQGEEDIVKADYQGEILEAEVNEHYTHLFLTSVRGEAKDILAGASSQSSRQNALTLYGLKPKTIEKKLKLPNLKSWKEFDAYSETMLNIALNVPVQYFDQWVPSRNHRQVVDFERETEALDFHVFYDGTELFKPIVLVAPDEWVLIKRFHYDGEHVSAKGYFYAQHGTIRPRELQGLLVRIRHAAVGEYDHSFWGFSPSDSPLIQRWVSSEIWADDRLEEAMNIDRRTLREAHPAFAELRNALHKELRSVLNQATNAIYKESRIQREDLANTIEKLASEIIAPVAPEAARNIKKTLSRAVAKTAVRRALQRKFTVTEFYETVINAGKDVLTPKQLEKFLDRLTELVGNEPKETSQS